MSNFNQLRKCSSYTYMCVEGGGCGCLCMGGCFDNCVGVLVIRVLVFTAFCIVSTVLLYFFLYAYLLLFVLV